MYAIDWNETRCSGEIPFSRVNVHTVIQAPDGRRMSKSLGTGIDPMQLIEGGPRPPVFAEGGDFPAYGADAVRYGLLAMSSSQDVRFNEERIAQGRQLANKLFNASRLVLLRVPDGVSVPASAPAPLAVEDTWILSRLQAAKADVADAIETFEFHRAAHTLYDFVYGELCDWYLEFTKGREVDEDLSATLVHVLRETLALAHPVIPFVTEELWDHVPDSGGLLAQQIAEQRTLGERPGQPVGVRGRSRGLAPAFPLAQQEGHEDLLARLEVAEQVGLRQPDLAADLAERRLAHGTLRGERAGRGEDRRPALCLLLGAASALVGHGVAV